jgi:hypothetical protein
MARKLSVLDYDRGFVEFMDRHVPSEVTRATFEQRVRQLAPWEYVCVYVGANGRIAGVASMRFAQQRSQDAQCVVCEVFAESEAARAGLVAHMRQQAGERRVSRAML